MILFLAGNFAIMGNKKEEESLLSYLGDDYNRLCAFYYKKESDVVIDIIGNKDEQKRIIKRSNRSKTRRRK